MSSLRFLADENCDHAIVLALRADGYDVAALAETTTRSVDALVIEQARREQRILLTEDKDFGWLVYVKAAASIGVILIRFPAPARTGLGAAISQLVRDHAGQIDGAFTVVEPGRVRINRLPGAPGS
jgi:predicted nuclease of predicted toxin-antitoxin system